MTTRRQILPRKDVLDQIDGCMENYVCGIVGRTINEDLDWLANTLFSEPSLARIWDTPEEDEAWKDL